MDQSNSPELQHSEYAVCRWAGTDDGGMRGEATRTFPYWKRSLFHRVKNGAPGSCCNGTPPPPRLPELSRLCGWPAASPHIPALGIFRASFLRRRLLDVSVWFTGVIRARDMAPSNQREAEIFSFKDQIGAQVWQRDEKGVVKEISLSALDGKYVGKIARAHSLLAPELHAGLTIGRQSPCIHACVSSRYLLLAARQPSMHRIH